MWFGNRPDAARKIFTPPRPPDNMLGDMPLCELEFLDAGMALSNRLLNWDHLANEKILLTLQMLTLFAIPKNFRGQIATAPSDSRIRCK